MADYGKLYKNELNKKRKQKVRDTMVGYRAPDDEDAEWVQLLEYDGLSGRRNPENQYSRLVLPCICAIGMCPSAAGARAPLAQICSYVTRIVLEAKVDLYRRMHFRWCRIKHA